MAQNGVTEPGWKNELRLYARVEVEWTRSQKYVRILNWREVQRPVILCVIIVWQELSFTYFKQAAECLSVGEG